MIAGHPCVRPLDVGNYDLSPIDKDDAVIVAIVLLDTNGQQALIVCILSFSMESWSPHIEELSK